MSPLSVAQYLPADGKPFDLVVFDEASQICTHEAIGAIARGRQVVIVGDSRQMPPSNFFMRTDSDDELPDEDESERIVTRSKERTPELESP
jgi:superfamily I DNA and/or RNA helicase